MMREDGVVLKMGRSRGPEREERRERLYMGFEYEGAGV